MSAYTVRSAIAGDIPSIMAIEREAETAAHWPATEYERIVMLGSIPRTALVIEEEGQIAGFVVARSIDKEWELENVAIRSQPQDDRVSDAHWSNTCSNSRAKRPLLASFSKCANRITTPVSFIHNLGSARPDADRLTTRILLKTQLLTKLLLEYDQNH